MSVHLPSDYLLPASSNSNVFTVANQSTVVGSQQPQQVYIANNSYHNQNSYQVSILEIFGFKIFFFVTDALDKKSRVLMSGMY
jgi:hypothetical protein